MIDIQHILPIMKTKETHQESDFVMENIELGN